MICLSHNERGDLLTGDSNGTVYVWGDGGNKITNFIKHGHDVCTIVWRCLPKTGILIVLICWFGMTMNFYLHFPAVCLLVCCCLFVCLLLFIVFLFLFCCLFVCLLFKVPVENISLILISHYYYWKENNLGYWSALTALDQGGIIIVPYNCFDMEPRFIRSRSKY